MGLRKMECIEYLCLKTVKVNITLARNMNSNGSPM